MNFWKIPIITWVVWVFWHWILCILLLFSPLEGEIGSLLGHLLGTSPNWPNGEKPPGLFWGNTFLGLTQESLLKWDLFGGIKVDVNVWENKVKTLGDGDVFLCWAVLSDEQMSNGYPFSLLNDEQMSNKVGVKHQPVGDGDVVCRDDPGPLASHIMGRKNWSKQ